VKHEVIWSVRAIDAAAGFLHDDIQGLGELVIVLDTLATNPRPKGSIRLGPTGFRRLRSGRYRVVYDVDPRGLTVTIVHLGRVG